MDAETFIVSVEVNVEGAEGGWNAQPIIDAARDAWKSPTPQYVRSVTIERKNARVLDGESTP